MQMLVLVSHIKFCFMCDCVFVWTATIISISIVFYLSDRVQGSPGVESLRLRAYLLPSLKSRWPGGSWAPVV